MRLRVCNARGVVELFFQVEQMLAIDSRPVKVFAQTPDCGTLSAKTNQPSIEIETKRTEMSGIHAQSL